MLPLFLSDSIDSVTEFILEVFDVHGLIEEKSLCHFAVVLGEKLELFHSLHALGHALQSHLLGHSNDVIEKDPVLPYILRAAGREEAFVQFQHVPRDLLDEIQ